MNNQFIKYILFTVLTWACFDRTIYAYTTIINHRELTEYQRPYHNITKPLRAIVPIVPQYQEIKGKHVASSNILFVKNDGNIIKSVMFTEKEIQALIILGKKMNNQYEFELLLDSSLTCPKQKFMNMVKAKIEDYDDPTLASSQIF